MSELARERNAAAESARPACVRWLCAAEDSLVIAVLAALAIFPLAEIVLRKTTGFGITGSGPFVQHFTLLVSVLGGALAARENRLLSLSSLSSLLKVKLDDAEARMVCDVPIGVTTLEENVQPLAWGAQISFRRGVPPFGQPDRPAAGCGLDFLEQQE